MRKTFRSTTIVACLTVFGAAGSPATAQQGTITANKGAISVVTLTETAASTTTSGSYTNLASTVVNIPAGQAGHVLVSFTGEARCSAGGSTHSCYMRILVDGTEAHPRYGPEGLDIWRMTAGDLFWETLSIDGVSDELPAGNHTVTVQWAVAGQEFRLDDWQIKAVVWRSR